MWEKIKEKWKELISLNESPERISLAFAIGVFIAFSPTMGLHTLSVLAACYFFKLNLGVTFLGAFINNPWSMVPLYAGSLWFGMWITGQEYTGIDVKWGEITFSNFIHILKPYLWSFIVGTVILGIFFAGLAYVLMKRFLTGMQSRRAVVKGTVVKNEADL